MNTQNGDLDTLIQNKLEADTEFLSSIESLSDEEKAQKTTEKKAEILATEFKTLSEKAAEAAKNKELADNYKVRAEKAEKEKKNKADKGESDDSTLSTGDLYSLMNAKVPEEDVEEVTKAARLLGKKVSEALKDPIVKSILEKKQQERDIANAANTNSARRTAAQVTEQTLKDDLKQGKVPEQGSPDAERLFWARRGGKR